MSPAPRGGGSPVALVRTRRAVSLGSAIAGPLAVAALLSPLRTRIADAALALVLTAVLVGIAALGDRLAGAIASLSSGLWFDFFLTRPYDRFSIASAHDIETTVALLVVGLAVTEIAARSRRYYGVASAEGDYLARIRDLSELVATGGALEAVVTLAERDLVEVLGLQSCRFVPGPSSAQRARLQRNGEVEHGTRRYDVAVAGLPPGEIELVASHGGVEAGVFVMEAANAKPLPIEPRVVALALADQVGAAFAGATHAEWH